MLTSQVVTTNFKDKAKIKHAIKTLFPSNERAPFWFLLQRAKKEGIDFLAFYDSDSEGNDIFVGYAYIITVVKGSDPLTTGVSRTLVFNLIVDGSQHSKGYGSGILEYIKQRYAPNPIDLNIEAVIEGCENLEQRQKRKAFYLKNGFVDSGNRCIQLKQP